MWFALAAVGLPLLSHYLNPSWGWHAGAALFLLGAAVWRLLVAPARGQPGDGRGGAVGLPLRGRGALVVGAASGLGRAISCELARCGARLELWDVQVEGLDQLAKELAAGGTEVQTSQVDITDSGAVIAAMAEAERRLGRDGGGGIRLLINSAGCMSGQPLATPSARSQPSPAQLQRGGWALPRSSLCLRQFRLRCACV
eukprot:COSAG01_NODE_10157_length_2234_cov_3.341920_3_plen_199_part_00